ncbi:MAG: AtpZ/AtpI family protein [Bacteroidetes bacterium]|nr:AtpZ/AtpI family protein [Bacteroidota bacterium]
MPELPDNKFLKYSSLGLQLLAMIGAAGWIGFQIDSYLHLSFPVFLLGLILIAFVGMMYKLYRSLNE